MKAGFEKIKEFSLNRRLIEKKLLEKIINTCYISYFSNLRYGWMQLQKNYWEKT